MSDAPARDRDLEPALDRVSAQVTALGVALVVVATAIGVMSPAR
jgi:hypothetical protein